MSITHHPSDPTLLAYAAGGLSEGLSLAVATHLACCAACRAAVEATEAAGGLLLSQSAPAECSQGLLAHTLQALERRAPADTAPPPARRGSVLSELRLPQPLSGYVDRLGESRWRRLGPGVEQIPLIRRTAEGGTARLLRVDPGRAIPRHGHAGQELALVLAGSYRDEIGRFARGDLADLDEETTHQPRADEREGCVCLIATEGPLRFEGRLLRLLRPVLGF